MKKFLRGFLVLTLITGTVIYTDSCCNTSSSCCSNCNDCDCSICPCDGSPFLSYRSQGRNAARELSGWQKFINKYCMEENYGAFAIAVEHTRTFKPERITEFLFGSDLGNCCSTLSIQGSAVQNRSTNAWLADYFGLAPDFESCISFCPHIKNVIIDLNVYLGLSEHREGLFFRVHAPLVWTKWKLNMSECVSNSGSGTFLPGYMAQKEIRRVNLPDTFEKAMNAHTTFGDMKDPIKFGRITDCKLTKVSIADIHASLGWNFKTDEDYHLGLFAHLVVPTGTRPSATYLFEPIVGNGKHWELGLGLTGSYIFWRSEEYCDRYVGIWLDGTFTHMFKAHQCRSFDFCHKPNSRYMLLAQMGSNDDPVIYGYDDSVDSEPVAASYKYKNNLIPAINWSTLNIDVKINFQADIVLKLGYVRENWTFDLGYNLWARTGEKFCFDCDDCCCSEPEKNYAIKGDGSLYGRVEEDIFALSATQNNADIHTGKNYPSQNTDEPRANPRIDNPKPAVLTGGVPLRVIGESDVINTSIQPVITSHSDLNLGKSPSAITHKIFFSLNYAWTDRYEEEWVPFIGFGYEAEFSHRNKCCNNNCTTYVSSSSEPTRNGTSSTTSYTNNCNSCCDSHKKAAIYQHGVWFKGGFAFD